jgi:hypothetical protein
MKYQTLDRKLTYLRETQNPDNQKNGNNRNTFELHPSVKNLTDIPFNDHELTLLQKGLKYNIHPAPKQWIKNLGMEAETAVNLLPHTDRNPIRYQIAKAIEKLEKTNKHVRKNF